MSRMMVALISMAVLSGCQHSSGPRCLSIMTARLQTLGPHCTVCGPGSRQCDDCIPHRPYTYKYLPAWDYTITQHTAHVCAFRGLKSYRMQCGGGVSHHFKMGFISAYEDLALNRKPIPPIVPPPRYWNAFYRSCAGQQGVDDWFAGYDAGLEMGSQSGVSRFGQIALRRNGCQGGLMNQYASGAPNADASADFIDNNQMPATSPPGIYTGTPNWQSPFNPYGNMSAPAPYSPYGLQTQ